MKQLSHTDLQTLVAQYAALEAWTALRNFCNQVYGPHKVHKVDIETEANSDDEGGSTYSIESLYAYDADGKEVPYDFSLPFWQQACFSDLFTNDGYNDSSDVQDDATEALREWCVYSDEEKAISLQHQWVEWTDLPTEPTIYDLTQEPPIRFPVVFAQ